MSSNTFGNIFTLTTFGESHGPALGAVIDGCPAGIALCEDDFLPELARRRPGQSDITTARKEADAPEIISGVFEGKTTGMPITVLIKNENQQSKDYEHLRENFRPGHADETYAGKFGHRDHRGGGRSSGRETVCRIIAGVIARKILPENMQILGHTVQIGPHLAEEFSPEAIEQNPVRCADPNAAKEMEKYILSLKEEYNSTGGVVEVRTINPPENLGDPVFKKMKARLADAVMSIGAVTGYCYGAGWETAQMRGLDYVADRANFGGMLGGITTGEDLVIRASIKPTTSVGEVAKKGRHDPCIVPRVVPVLEAMVATTLADAYLMNSAYSPFHS